MVKLAFQSQHPPLKLPIVRQRSRNLKGVRRPLFFASTVHLSQRNLGSLGSTEPTPGNKPVSVKFWFGVFFQKLPGDGETFISVFTNDSESYQHVCSAQTA